METMAAKLHESASNLARQRDAFLARTRSAGAAFLGETRDAGSQLVGAMHAEARRWRRFAAARAARVQAVARATSSLPALERAVLAPLGETLHALDARVHARLAELEPRPARAARQPSAAKQGHRARPRRGRGALPPMAA